MQEKRNIFDSVSFWIIAAATFILPLFVVSPTMLGGGIAKLGFFSVAVLLAFCAFIIERIRQGSVSLPWRLSYLLLLAVPLTYLVASLTGVAWYKSLIGGLFEQDTFHTIAICFLYMFLIITVANNAKRVTTLLLAASGSIFLAAIFQIVRLFAGNALSLGGVLSSPAATLAGNWNDLTALMVLLLGVLIIALETMKLRKWVMTTLTVLLALPFFFVAISIYNFTFDFFFFRFGFPLLIAILALFIFTYMYSLQKGKEGHTEKTMASSASFIVLIAAILLVVFGGPLHNFLVAKTGVNYLAGQPNWIPTYDIARDTLKSHPVLGSGPNTFAYEWNLHKPVAINSNPFWNTNFAFGIGIIPSAAVTLGIIGLAIWLLFYAFVLFRVWNMLFRVEKGTQSPLKIIVAFGVLYTTLIMFLYTPGLPLEVMHFLFVGLLFGLDATGKRQKMFAFNAKQWQHFTSILVLIVLLVGTLAWGFEVAKKIGAAYYTNQALAKSGSEDEALGYMQKALLLDPTQPIYSQLVAQIYASKITRMAQLPASEIEAKKAELQNNIYAAVNYALLAERLDPTDFNAPIVTGRLLEYLGALGIPQTYEQAVQKYLGASALSPSNPLPFIFAANASLEANNASAAQQYLVKAIGLKQDYSDSPALAQGIFSLSEILKKGSTKSVAPAIKSATTTATTTDEEEEDSKE